MLSNKKFLIIGGDTRFNLLFQILKDKCKRCVYLNCGKDISLFSSFIKSFDVIVFPLPLTKDGVYINSQNESFNLKIEDVINAIDENTIVLGGIIPESYKRLLEKKNIKYYDYYTNKDFLALNSHLTALGTMKLICGENKFEEKHKNVLITGYGYLAKALCTCADELGMNVSLIARKQKNRADAQEHGFDAYDFPIYEDMLQKFDYIFNTVPSKIFSEENIKKLKKDTVFVELASKPYGTDPEFFIVYGKKYICGQSLPGRFYPKECAVGIFDAIRSYFSLEGDEN